VKRYRPLVLLCLLLLHAPASAQPQPDAATPAHVVLVSIDGLAAYHLRNPSLELPNLRELVAAGAVAEGAVSVFPSVTHPAHASLVTGVSPRRHGVLGNRLTHRATGETFHVSTLPRAEAVRARTLFDAAHEAGLTTAAICWPETRGDTSLDFNILHGHDELDPAEVDPALLAALRAAGVPIDAHYAWAAHGPLLQGARDMILALAAAEVIRTHRPALTAVHFAGTDAVQHRYGPDHYLAWEALTRADFHLGLLRQAVRDAGLEERTTFLVVTDHGFHTVRRQVDLQPLLAASGLADRVRLHPDRWSLFIELTDAFDPVRDQAALETFFQEAQRAVGTEHLFRPDDFHRRGLPRYEESPYVRGQYLLVADIDTYLTAATAAGSARPEPLPRPSHYHGYLPEHPRMHGALVLAGRGVRAGHRFGVVEILDVAPTVARLLGLQMPDVEGRVLREALEN
jgi:arylsulfatase A-like enzyme